jgi:hypothetical protein
MAVIIVVIFHLLLGLLCGLEMGVNFRDCSCENTFELVACLVAGYATTYYIVKKVLLYK